MTNNEMLIYEKGPDFTEENVESKVIDSVEVQEIQENDKDK